jgi:transposase-like protein
MIQDIVTYKCPDCGSAELVKNRHDYKGSQKYHCKTCNRYETVQATKCYSHQQQGQVKRAVLERSSLRG